MDRSDRPWEDLRTILDLDRREELTSYLDQLSPPQTALAISRLSQEEQSKLLLLLRPADAAEVIQDVPDAQAAVIVWFAPFKEYLIPMFAAVEFGIDIPTEK